MAIVSAVGRDRPGAGVWVTILDEAARLSSEVRRSAETEVSIAVARTRDGRRVRLGLGAELTLAWPDLAEVRCRRYRVADVLGGGDAQWRLHPLAPAETGDRRLAPRADVVVPVGVQGGEGLVVGESIDLSTTGARIAFPAVLPLRPLPAAGDTVQLVLLLEGTRLEVAADVVRATARAEGTRELRLSFAEPDPGTREALRSAVDTALAAQVS